MTKSTQAFKHGVQKALFSATLALSLLVGAGTFAMPSLASAASLSSSSPAVAIAVPTQVVAADSCPKAGKNNGHGLQCLVDTYITPLVQLVSALVGLITVISIVIAGIQYSTSADDPSKVQAAKTRIINSLIAFLAFIFLYAFLQFILPGGLMNGKIN